MKDNFDYSKTYWKITNESEIHKGMEYKTGLNTDILPFNNDESKSCVKGGLYFTDLENISKFFGYGVWARPITIPENEVVIKDPENDKWRTHSFVMGEKIPKVKLVNMLPKEIGGWLDLRGCNLEGIVLPRKIGGWLNLSGCNLEGIVLPKEIGGGLNLSGCNLEGIVLPKKIGGWLDLRGCNLEGIVLPKEIGGGLDLRGCTNTDKLIIPQDTKVRR